MDVQVHSETRSDWAPLLGRSGLALAVLLAAAGAALQDVEAAALALGGFVAVALLHVRGGMLGAIGVGALAVDVVAWMGPGAFSNITHGEGYAETALPALLTVAATTAGFSALADVVRRRTTVPVRPRTIGVAGVGFAIAALIVPAIGIGTAVRAVPGDLEVTTEDLRFSDEDMRGEAGTIGVLVDNRDLFWHTFTIDELDVNVSVPVGGLRRASFEAAPGTYTFVCAIPGHEQAGMEGTLTVR